MAAVPRAPRTPQLMPDATPPDSPPDSPPAASADVFADAVTQAAREIGPWAVVRLHCDGTVAEWSPAAAALFDVPAPQALGRPVAALLGAAPHRRLADAFQAVLDGGPAATVVVPLRRPDGTPVVTAWTVVPTCDANRAAAGLLATGIPLPDVAAGEPAHAAEQFWRGVFDANPLAVAVVGPDDRLVGVNARFTELFGYTEDEALGRNLTALVATAAGPEVPAALRGLAVGARLAYDAERHTKAGRRVLVHVEAAAFEPGEGQRGVVVAYRDLREQRAFEAQLVRAQRLEGVALLAAGVLHDVNNLLMVVLGQADALAEAPPDAPLDAGRREDVALLREAARRAAALARTVGSFARPEGTQLDLVDLRQLLARLRPVLDGVVGRRVAVRLDVDPATDLVRAVPAELEQVVVNLAANARDAMPGGGTLHIDARPATVDADEAARRSVVPGRYVALDVADTGVGMSPEVARHAFDPFYTTKAGTGTGLGLATVDRIVRRTGGAVTVESAEGAGTTFHVLLPASVDDA